MGEEQEIRRIRLRKLIEDDFEGTAARFAELYDAEPSYISNLLSGRQNIGERVARKIERVAGKPKLWLDSDSAPVVHAADHGLTLPYPTIRIPMFDAEASMGIGKPMPDFDTVIGALQLSETWVRTHLPAISNPRNLATLSAYGDSMAPTFADGDILLIDRGVCEVKLDAVYVLALNDELFVKRIQRRISGELVIKSDNPLYDAHVVENGEKETLKVLGRVVWAWNGKKL